VSARWRPIAGLASLAAGSVVILLLRSQLVFEPWFETLLAHGDRWMLAAFAALALGLALLVRHFTARSRRLPVRVAGRVSVVAFRIVLVLGLALLVWTAPFRIEVHRYETPAGDEAILALRTTLSSTAVLFVRGESGAWREVARRGLRPDPPFGIRASGVSGRLLVVGMETEDRMAVLVDLGSHRLLTQQRDDVDPVAIRREFGVSEGLFYPANGK